MGFNRFYLSVIIYVVLITICSFTFFYFLTVTNQLTTAAGTGIIAVLIMFRFIYYVNRTNRMLGDFFIYMKEEDPSLTYTRKYTDRNFKGLSRKMELLIREFKEDRLEKEVQARYLQTIVDNVTTGIISFDQSGYVHLMNNAARELLNIRKLNTIDELNHCYPELGSGIRFLKPRDQMTEKIIAKGKFHHLSINAAVIRMKGIRNHIITLNDIKYQMEEQEIESWKKLIRVINHEILNSITPIITLTTAIKKRLLKKQDKKAMRKVNEKDIRYALDSTDIIEERSRGLINFIDRYRKLTRLVPLQLSSVNIQELFQRIQFLFKEEPGMKGITLKVDYQETDTLMADPKMLEQMMINLVKNSMEALENIKDPFIKLDYCLDEEQRKIIRIRDNGTGIEPETLVQVFVPFFTTKEGGSGIGLSLCRQIMRMHKGEIHIDSEPGEGTEVKLRF
jgi:two-component system nitrogen regulation sensor histidine kinase NtrY